MKIRVVTTNIFYALIVVFGLGVSSCTPVKNVVYFQNLQKDTTLHNVVNNNFELKIRKNDLLGITILSSDKDQTPLFNGQQSLASQTTTAANSGTPSGFLVDENGNIVLYKIGVIHAEGLTRNEFRQKLQKAIVPDYLKEAVITVRFLSNHVTILGEVAKPQVLSMQNEQLPLLEAIGQSGDILISGRKDNVLVIRETSNGKQFKRLNLTDNSIFSSSFYYLKPDDVVYVEPTKSKINNNAQTQQIISYALSGLTILVTILFYLISHK